VNKVEGVSKHWLMELLRGDMGTEVPKRYLL